jgi:hypothetical protein
MLDVKTVLHTIIGLGIGVSIMSAVWGYQMINNHPSDPWADGFTIGTFIAGLGAIGTASAALFLK